MPPMMPIQTVSPVLIPESELQLVIAQPDTMMITNLLTVKLVMLFATLVTLMDVSLVLKTELTLLNVDVWMVCSKMLKVSANLALMNAEIVTSTDV